MANRAEHLAIAQNIKTRRVEIHAGNNVFDFKEPYQVTQKYNYNGITLEVDSSMGSARYYDVNVETAQMVFSCLVGMIEELNASRVEASVSL